MNKAENVYDLNRYRINKEVSDSLSSFNISNIDDSTGSEPQQISVSQIQNLIGKLYDLFQECKFPNWNGDNAEPISDATFHNATKLIAVLPVNLPLPEILPDNDGYIEFEWYNKGRSFSLYVTDRNLVLYAGYYGKDNRLSGRFNFEKNFPVLAMQIAENVF